LMQWEGESTLPFLRQRFPSESLQNLLSSVTEADEATPGFHLSSASSPSFASFMQRIPTAAQYHFWYLFKMLYPRHLSFDYGAPCIPFVSSPLDWRNVLPLLMYLAAGRLMFIGVRDMRIALLLGLGLTLAPLLPVFLVLFTAAATGGGAVGGVSLLSERLLLAPSMGLCLLLGELLTVDCRMVWLDLSASVLDPMLESVASSLPVRLVGRKGAPTVQSPDRDKDKEKDRDSDRERHKSSVGKFPVSSAVRKSPSSSEKKAQNVSFALDEEPAEPSGGLRISSCYIFVTCLVALWSLRVLHRNNEW